jgi:hypothetical protein
MNIGPEIRDRRMKPPMTVRGSHPDSADGMIEGFRYLWASYVKSFDPAAHCQACLKGALATNFNSKTAQIGRDIALERAPAFPFVYLCGVAAGKSEYREERNLHLPLRYVEGRVAEGVTYNGYRFTVVNAELLRIPSLPDYWNGLPDVHRRCKVFQFGVAYLRECVPELRPVDESLAHDGTLWRIQEMFRGVIMSRVREGRLAVPRHMPRLSRNMLREKEPIPGMAGGFAYRMSLRGDVLELVAESWSRMAGGSGMRHRITEKAALLEAEGFV